MTTRTERTRRRRALNPRSAATVLLSAFVVSAPVPAQSVNPLVFEVGPPTRLRSETDGDAQGSERCQSLARVIERELQAQPARGVTLLQYYRRECAGEPLPAGAP